MNQTTNILIDKELIDEATECLKAIERCVDHEGLCGNCPYREIKYPWCKEKLIEQVSKFIKIHIPQKVVVKNWSPNKCPTCGCEIDESEGDGYYKHPEYIRCPHCAQRLRY